MSVPPAAGTTWGTTRQIIWKNTKEAQWLREDHGAWRQPNIFRSGRYSPPGNYVGEKPYLR